MAKKRAKKKAVAKSVETIKHQQDKRKNIPTAEMTSVMEDKEKYGRKIKYSRNTDLDPQLVWRGKDEQDWSDLVVDAPPLYIQEKVHPKVLIDDLLKQTKEQGERETLAEGGEQLDIFGDFNGLPEEARSTEFYEHEANWTNRMILGDSLQVMASLAEREGLRGKVQCIYIDPPYGIKFNSNFQWSTTDKLGTTTDSVEKISREPEQVKAFRDTWRDGINSYLSYLRDRFSVSRELLSSTGSVFLQISDENVHRVRALMDEVFGENNFVAIIPFRKKTMPFGSKFIEQMSDFIIWYAKQKTDSRGNSVAKYRKQYLSRSVEGEFHHCWYETSDGGRHRMSRHQLYNHSLLPSNSRVYRLKSLEPSGRMSSGMFDFEFEGQVYKHPKNGFGTTKEGLLNLKKSARLQPEGNRLCYVLYADEGESSQMTAPWNDTVGADNKNYVVQTNTEVIKRCILMTSDPGDLVLDPTCGSGATAFVAEQWGRRWITVDTSRVSLTLARARVMAARYPFYLLSDSKGGQAKEAELNGNLVSPAQCLDNIKHGFVYSRITRTTLSSIANNESVNVVWGEYEQSYNSALAELNDLLGEKWEDYELPAQASEEWPPAAKRLFSDLRKVAAKRQKQINAAIVSSSNFEFLYDRPYEDKSKVRVAGPFTVESLSPHRMLGVDEDDELIDPIEHPNRGDRADFATMILDNLKKAGVQQSSKEDKIKFTSITLWPGRYVCAEGRYTEGDKGSETEKRAGIFIGPEFGTVSREDLVGASRECGEADFDVLIACAFNYEAHAHEFNKLGKVQVLKAHMNADLHMGDELANTGKGNLFVVFGEPDIDIIDEGKDEIKVKINGVDIFHPNSGEIRSDDTDGIACWFIDTDYNEESFFVRHAYFLGAGDPYKSLKTTLKAEINQEAWETLNSDTSRPFKKPGSGRIAVKVINHLGDEVMKVFKVD